MKQMMVVAHFGHLTQVRVKVKAFTAQQAVTLAQRGTPVKFTQDVEVFDVFGQKLLG